MKNIFIFHGTGGYPEENWFPWLKSQIEAHGKSCIVPQFPTPEGQSVQAWRKVLEPYEQDLNPESILIGHSLGGLFLLRLLEQSETRIRAAFFIGTPIGVEPTVNIAADRSFAGGLDFDWARIRTKAERFSVFHSDNDPYVCLGNGEMLARELGVPLTFIPNAGHFNTAAGYVQFPELWKQVEEILL